MCPPDCRPDFTKAKAAPKPKGGGKALKRLKPEDSDDEGVVTHVRLTPSV